jgi:molybdopterin-biosynthesis enzyme MoeA-like protein
LERADIVITSGGLGPTQDDLTREIVAEVTGRKLILDSGLLEQVEEHFRRRGRTMTPNNRRQGYMPEGAIPVTNPNGTAPSFIVEDPRGIVFSLPGVPVELKWLFENEVDPYLRKKFNLAEVIHYRVLKVVGIGESAVDDQIGYLIANSSNPTVGVLALPGQVDVRIAAKAANKEQAIRLIAPVESEVRRLLGNAIFAADQETMEDVVGRLLRARHKTVAVYEDLTCGNLSERLQAASAESFGAGVICNSEIATRALLTHGRNPGRTDSLIGASCGDRPREHGGEPCARSELCCPHRWRKICPTTEHFRGSRAIRPHPHDPQRSRSATHRVTRRYALGEHIRIDHVALFSFHKRLAEKRSGDLAVDAVTLGRVINLGE